MEDAEEHLLKKNGLEEHETTQNTEPEIHIHPKFNAPREQQSIENSIQSNSEPPQYELDG